MTSVCETNDRLLTLVNELCREVSLRNESSRDMSAVESELEAALHDLNVYQEEVNTQSENLQCTVQELDSLYRKYVNLFDFAPIGYFTFNTSGIITEVNLTGADLLALPRQFVIGKPMLIYLSKDSREAFFSHLRAVFSDIHHTVEVEVMNRDGKLSPVVLESSPIKDGFGNITFCRTAAVDISDQKEAERALKKARDELEKRVEERTRELRASNDSLHREINLRKAAEQELSAEKEILDITLRSIGDGIVTTDIHGKVLMMNEVAEKLTGWKLQSAHGRPLNEVFHILDEYTRAVKPNPVDKVFASGKISELSNHTILKEKDGEERIIENSGLPIRDKNDRIIGGVLVVRDVTAEKKREEERLRNNKLESLGFLAGGLAHDFNNLLTAIIGNITLAKSMSSAGENVDEILTNAENACMRAKTLTTQLLTFSKGGLPIKTVSSLEDLLRESIEFVTRGTGVQCHFDIFPNLYAAEIDAGQINQVLNNLIINSIQAMDRGGSIDIKAANTRLKKDSGIPLKPGNYVKISIQDQGKGIIKENLDKIFDPYFTTKTMGKHKGCGLGLATSYSIIKNHQGHISVESVPGQGTTFHIYLPATLKKPTLRKNRVTQDKPASGRILVMDDEYILRDISTQFLSRLGYVVETAADGKEAIHLYEQALDNKAPYDVVIMDLTIPGGMGGKEAISELRKIAPKVKAIVSSGYSNDPVMANYKRYGFDAVIAKPFKLDELRNILDTVSS